MAAETKKARKKRAAENAATKSETKGNIFTNFISYLREVRNELNKVTWPNREEVANLTRIVLIVTILSSIILGAVGAGFTLLTEFGLENAVVFVVLFAAILIGAIYFMRRGSTRSSY
jgi:preprotein translocase SecE subunit